MKVSQKTVFKSIFIIGLLILWPNALAYNANLNQFKNGRNIKEALYEPGQVLVKFKQDSSKPKQKQIMSKAGIRQTLETIGPEKEQNIQLLELKNNETVEEAVSKLEEQDLVEYAEPNYIGHGAFIPNDSGFSNQWGLNNTGQTIEGTPGKVDADIDMSEAWENIGNIGKISVIAVLDSGIDSNHPDLQGQIWTNSGEIGTDIEGLDKKSNGKDDDKNGYVDDVNGLNWGNISQNFYFKYNSANNTLNYLYYPIGRNSPNQTNSEIAQSFRGNGGYINRIAVALKKNGTPSQDVKVSIRNDLNGVDLAYTNVNKSEILTGWTTSGAGNWINKDLSSQVKVNNNDTYFLVVHTDNQDNSNFYEVGSSLYESNGNADRFPDGKAYIKNESWTDMNKDDISFKLMFDTEKDGKGGGVPRDNYGHGTHVSGIAVATTGNNKGVAGIAGYPANAAKIMPLRVVDSSGSGNYSDWIDAIYYAADNGADVINMSLEGTSESLALQDAVNYAVNEKGAIIIAAAGNNDGNKVRYPAGLENVVGVSSTTNTDVLASTSNYNASVDLSAPGENIYSTTPTYPHYKSTAITPKKLEYDFYSGTSMATSIVSGIAALIKSKWPSYSPAQIEQLMKEKSDDLGEEGRDDYFGSGRINAAHIFDTTAPTVWQGVTTQSSGKYVRGVINLQANVTDNLAVSKVSYFRDSLSSPLGTSDLSPYSVSWDTRNSSNGKHNILTYAYDEAGNSDYAVTLLNVDNYKPRTYAPYSRRVRKGRYVRLYYKVKDPHTGNKAYVIIRIRKGKKTVRTIKHGWQKIQRGGTVLLKYYRFLAKLARGKYKFYIYAKDRAGNIQYKASSNLLVVT